MATVFEHLTIVNLKDNELESAEDCVKQVKALEFVAGACVVRKGLEIASRNFINKFALWSKV